MLWILIATLWSSTYSLELPANCAPDQYYDPASLNCQTCLANSSLIRSRDGFSCSCDERSVPTSPGSCKPCSATEVVSSDGTVCVPRKCQNVGGRVACRKCPGDYISVSQNFDGTPMKEMQCIKCARGYKPVGNICVRCEACTCTKTQVVVRGICVPKTYVNERPIYSEKSLHPLELLDVLKHEYLCVQNHSRMCRTLANECAENFYSSDLGGPCRLWLKPQLAPKGLPSLLVNDKTSGTMNLPREKGVVRLSVAAFTSDGGMIFLNELNQHKELCFLPLSITIGSDFTHVCTMNLTSLSSSVMNETLSPIVLSDEGYKPLSVSLIKPNGYILQKGSWPNSTFSRYFIVHRTLSTVTNVTNTVYLKMMAITLIIHRDSHADGSLRLQISMEAQYATTDHLDSVTTTLKVEHSMPSAGVIRGLEICGGALGAFLTLYALVQWRGVLRRGGPHYSLVPLLAGATADVLYFAVLLTTLHALAAEAGTLGITLPLSKNEEIIVRDFLLFAVALKVLKIAWLNWKQCTCDVFFINWSEYNPPGIKDVLNNVNESWKASTLAREWSRVQTMRRACPGFTVTGALLVLHITTPWQHPYYQSRAYSWAISSIAWWFSYGVVLISSWLVDKFLVSPASDLPRVCTRLDLSLMVFQEEYYAHYVHGRNDDFQEVRSMTGPLATCRVACVPQLSRLISEDLHFAINFQYFYSAEPIVPMTPLLSSRTVCRQLSTPASGILGDTESKQSLLSKFLAAFFERALDGLNWVASERSVLERLLDVEVTSREAGGTSTLLYDDDNTPSCFNMTWWGEEWSLSTFDAMLFSCAFIASGDALLAALLTITTWQILKQIRIWFGNRNQVLKTGVEILFQ